MNVQPDSLGEAEAATGLGEVCYLAMRADILHGRLAPRARLRIERMREAYGASVSTLRETLSRLAGEGLVVVEGNRGFAVAPVTQTEFRELASLRLLLEQYAIDRSFARGDLEWEGAVVGAHHKLARMEQRMLAGEQDQSERWKHYDKAFHQALIAGCGSGTLIRAHAGIFDRYLRYQVVAMVFRGEVAAEEHQTMRNCAIDRDVAGAQEILRRHIEACVEYTTEAGVLDPGDVPEPGEWMVRQAPAAASGTVGEQVWARLREDILSGVLPPGRRLRLDTLKADYGVGVSTLREVLNRLATERLVVAEGQRGFETAPISREDLTEIAELRLLVETHALAASFRTGAVDWEARVVAAYHRLSLLEERMESGDLSVAQTWKRYDWEFHQALIAACGSPTLMQLHGTVFDKYLRYQRIALSFRGGVAAREHKLLLECALKRDADGARRILAEHLEGGVRHALESGRI